MKKLTYFAAVFGVLASWRPGLADSTGGETPAMTARAAARFLDQATFGPTAASITALQQSGIDAWLQAQFNLNVSDLPDQPILISTGLSNNNLGPVQEAFMENAVNQPDQLRQRVAFALTEIWVVSAVAGVSPAYAYPPYWRVFRDNAFGNYRDIIKAATLSPAMGRYLNMANNNKGNPAKGTAANENYGRELMQLFTLGLTQLRMNGQPVTDASGNPVPTYNQSAVTDMAKALTGWTYPTEPGVTGKANNPAFYNGPMFAVESHHDTSEKQIFDNITIPAGQTAEQDLESVLDALMAQPTMAPFISQQLIQHLVTSNPSPTYVGNVAKVFSATGGDMKAVITAILTDPEARNGDQPSTGTDANFGHLREPVLFLTGMLRGLNATFGTSSKVYNQATAMGQQLFYAPSVFSYFSPQNALPSGLLGPEFQIYSTQTAAARANVVNTLLYGTLDKSTRINLAPYLKFTSIDDLLSQLGAVFQYSSLPPDVQSAASSAATAVTTPTAKAQAALYIILTSGEYQVIH